MSRSVAVVFVISWVWVAQLQGQALPSASPPAVPSAKKEGKKPKQQPSESANPLLSGIKGASTNEPVTTEIYADDAFFDSNKNVGIFSGHVRVADPRFTLQSEKLTVYITKGENQGLEKAIAEGNVAVVRDRPDPNGGPPTRAVGRSDQATYVATTGNVELRGAPRVQEGVNTHIATSPDTVMVVNQNGQLTTHGPSRTEIRQEPKTGEGEKKGEGDKKGESAKKNEGEKKGEAKPSASPKESSTP